MAKKLSELYAPKPKDEKEFVAKHTIKPADTKLSPANKDVNFKPSTKVYDRKTRHGYMPGEDEKKYDRGDSPGPNDMKPTKGALPPSTTYEEEEPIEQVERRTGIAKAVDKLTKEEIEVEFNEDHIDMLLNLISELMEGKEPVNPSKTPVEAAPYNKDAVNKAISASKPKIGGKEAKMIHGLLKGWRGK
jgi:hypothetical protein